MCKRLRTDSIYTLRQTPTNYKQRIFWWQRGKGKDKEEEVVPPKYSSHLISQDYHPSAHYC